jgi:site-specific recombinase XerD
VFENSLQQSATGKGRCGTHRYGGLRSPPDSCGTQSPDVKNYRCDRAAFARWFRDTTGDELTPALITPTDLRDYKRFLVDQRRLKPSSVNRQLATLKSFLTWAAAAGLLPAGPPPALPKAVFQAQHGPRWLDRREQYALRRAVERGGQIRDIAMVMLLRASASCLPVVSCV